MGAGHLQPDTAIRGGARVTPEQLFEENIGLAHSFGSKYFYLGDYDEIVQLARIGLYEAARKFDASLGHKFSTYAYFHIRNTIIKSYERDNQLKIPKNVAEIMSYIKKYDLYDASVDEIYKKLPHHRKSAIGYAFSCLNMQVSSLDFSAGEDGNGSEMYDAIPGSSDSGWDFSIMFKDFFSSLPEHEQKAVTMTLEGHSQEKIGKCLGVTQNSISRYLRRVKAKYEIYAGEGELV